MGGTRVRRHKVPLTDGTDRMVRIIAVSDDALPPLDPFFSSFFVLLLILSFLGKARAVILCTQRYFLAAFFPPDFTPP